MTTELSTNLVKINFKEIIKRSVGENTTTTGDMFLLQELVDKATPLRPYRQYEIDWGMGNAGECSDCKNLVNYQNSYCGKCGQKLDWSDRSE